MKQCPDCAEQVQDEARVCRYCGFQFQAPLAEARPPRPQTGPSAEEAIRNLGKRISDPWAGLPRTNKVKLLALAALAIVGSVVVAVVLSRPSELEKTERIQQEIALMYQHATNYGGDPVAGCPYATSSDDIWECDVGFRGRVYEEVRYELVGEPGDWTATAKPGESDVGVRMPDLACCIGDDEQAVENFVD